MTQKETLLQAQEKAHIIGEHTKSFVNKNECYQIDKDVLLAHIREIYDIAYAIPVSVAPQAPQVEVIVETIYKQESHVEKATLVVEPVAPITATMEPATAEDDDLMIQIDAVTEEIEPEKPIVEAKKPQEPEKPVVSQQIIPEKPQFHNDYIHPHHFAPIETHPITASPLKKENEIESHEPISSAPLQNKLHPQKILNLRAEIGINDKFTFMKHLFNGNDESYQTALHDLNNLKTFAEATEYIVSNFSWEIEDPIVKKFIEIVHRRFL